MKKSAIIIQARLGSTRLPGKVLMPLAGRPVIEHVCRRVARSKFVDNVIVATTMLAQDDQIEAWCKANNIKVFRGSESDLLDRYYNAMMHFDLDVVVRITADCPLIDPDIIDTVIYSRELTGSDACWLSGEFPDGLDCQVFTIGAIEKAWKCAELKSDREHVGPYIENNRGGGFLLNKVELFSYMKDLRLTLDEQSDYVFLTKLFDKCADSDGEIELSKVFELLRAKPDLLSINQHIPRNEGYSKSVNEDI